MEHKRKRLWSVLWLSLALTFLLTLGVHAESEVSAGWVKTAQGYRWRLEDGSYYSSGKAGRVKLGGKYYYLSAKGVRKSGVFKVSGKLRYFDKKTGVQSKKTGWLTYGKNKYYLKKGAALTGVRKIGGKLYWFRTSSGRLFTNVKKCTYKGQTYTIDKNGVMKPYSYKEAAYQVARDFIDQVAGSASTAADKLFACYDYLGKNSRWLSLDDSYYHYEDPNWIYQVTIDYLTSSTLQADCHIFSISFSVIAKVLGYNPRMVIETDSHAIVILRDNNWYFDINYMERPLAPFSYSQADSVEEF